MSNLTLSKTPSSLFEVSSISSALWFWICIGIFGKLTFQFNEQMWSNLCGNLFNRFWVGNQLIDPDIYLRSLWILVAVGAQKSDFRLICPFLFFLLFSSNLRSFTMIPNRMMTVLSNFMGQLWPRKSGSSYNLDATESTT